MNDDDPNRSHTSWSIDGLASSRAGKGLEQVGDGVLSRITNAGRVITLFCETCAVVSDLRRRIRPLVHQIDHAGIGSILVLSLIAFLTGMIMAVQTGSELQKFGIIENLGAIIGATFVRELGPIWAAIIMLARVGAAMAAELGTMAVNEEIDALRVMNVCPVRYLVLPRIAALVLAMPLLTVVADMVGMAGGAMISTNMFNVTVETYTESAKGIITSLDFLSGLVKAMVYGAIIATIACDRGLHAHDGAEGVGRATTATVVLGVIFVLVANMVMTTFIQSVLKPALGVA